MHAYTLAFLALGAVVSAQEDRGQQTVAGLGESKQAILDAGGDTKDMALAMLETETMTTDYVYGMSIHLHIRVKGSQSRRMTPPPWPSPLFRLPNAVFS